ncbi:hypothetical protein BDK51DRAFT_51227 [Blyttiomyces helicus]|uniref:Uncharacterized protein n=1 Tax=Blyttiomyces helicus TaxID=388810 RepID=A0A4P9W2M1_9FUNG|nr:hypothetical protein BDK51DRAFT_51227 [Blyttiomyces helicus]|eukprot:RKO85625.1 hypothetical protein BDK51DRAFT_51227 [Blyttiomyces helicus]
MPRSFLPWSTSPAPSTSLGHGCPLVLDRPFKAYLLHLPLPSRRSASLVTKKKLFPFSRLPRSRGQLKSSITSLNPLFPSPAPILILEAMDALPQPSAPPPPSYALTRTRLRLPLLQPTVGVTRACSACKRPYRSCEGIGRGGHRERSKDPTDSDRGPDDTFTPNLRSTASRPVHEDRAGFCRSYESAGPRLRACYRPCLASSSTSAFSIKSGDTTAPSFIPEHVLAPRPSILGPIPYAVRRSVRRRHRRGASSSVE